MRRKQRVECQAAQPVGAAEAATNALSDGADIAKVQKCLGHTNVSTTGSRASLRTARHFM